MSNPSLTRRIGAVTDCHNSDTNGAGQRGTTRDTLLPSRIEGVRSPRDADPQTLALCRCEADAIVASVRLSGLSLREIAARMGCGKSSVGRCCKGQKLPEDLQRAFCNATGTNLISQYRDAQMAAHKGHQRERDRIAEIIAPTLAAWRAA